MKSFTVALVAFMAGICPAFTADVDPNQRYLEAYTEYSYQGPSTVFSDYVPDLSVYSIDNAIRSFCYTGFWLLNEEVNYVDYLRIAHGVNGCINFTSSSSDKASSLRYAGSPNGLNEVYYNLYEDSYWEGAEFTGNTDAPTVGALDLNVSSLIISGPSPWTFFTGLEYTGHAVCVYPEYSISGDDGYIMQYNYIHTMGFIYLYDNTIRSVAMGCLSEKIVGKPPSKASPHPEGDHEGINNAH